MSESLGSKLTHMVGNPEPGILGATLAGASGGFMASGIVTNMNGMDENGFPAKAIHVAGAVLGAAAGASYGIGVAIKNGVQAVEHGVQAIVPEMLDIKKLTSWRANSQKTEASKPEVSVPKNKGP